MRGCCARLRSVEGVDVLAWMEGDEACLWSDRGELRFAPGTRLTDRRGMTWDLDGSLDTIELEEQDGLTASRAYPDALRRVWAALALPRRR